MAIEDALAQWLGSQRWFAGKGMGPRDLAIVADTELVAGDPELRHLIVAVSHGTTVDYYQILVGLRRRLPERLDYARIGPIGDGPVGGGRIAYDALHDADLTKPLLAAMAAKEIYIGRIWPAWPTQVRVTVGTADEMIAFRNAFKEVMATNTAGLRPAPRPGRLAEHPFTHLS